MCGARLTILILVLIPFKFVVTLNSFMCISLYTNFIFETISHCSLSYCCCYSVASSSASFPRMYFNLCPPWSVFSFILLYYKEPFLYFFCRCVSCCCHLSWDIFSTSNQHWYRNRKKVGGNSLSHCFISFCFASVYVLFLALYTDTSNFLRWLCRFYCRCYNDYLNRDLRK